MDKALNIDKANELAERLKHLELACVEHPFVAGIADGSLPVERLKDFSIQDYWFLQEVYKIGALTVLRSPEVWAEELNVGKLYDEIGHCDLLFKFARAIGVTRRDFEDTRQLPGTMAITNYFHKICMFGNPAEFGAALGSVSKVFLEICSRITEGLTRHYRLSDEDIEFFTTHSRGTEARHHLLDWKLVSAFTKSENDYEKVFRAARLALQYEKMFFDTVMSATIK